MFKGKDGTVRFTDGRAVARRSPTVEGAVEGCVQTTEAGNPHYILATELIAISDAVLPGVLTVGRREGDTAPHMRARGLAAALSPWGDQPLAEQ
eukprot:1491018-Pleurochrysis_carterae.AAC.1